jgi:hypothetical protein
MFCFSLQRLHEEFRVKFYHSHFHGFNLRIASLSAPNNLKVSFTQPRTRNNTNRVLNRRANREESAAEKRSSIKHASCLCVEQKGRKSRKLKKEKEKSLCELNLHLKTLFLIRMVTSSLGYVLRIRYVYLS